MEDEQRVDAANKQNSCPEPLTAREFLINHIVAVLTFIGLGFMIGLFVGATMMW